MITIKTDSQKNTYSAYNICKAFFPLEDVKVVVSDDGKSPSEIYKDLSLKTGRELPWGMLTGVRPTKLAMSKIKEGMEKEDFVKWFYDERYVSQEKALLAYEIASRELSIAGEPSNSYCLYINIPFCPTICTYCSFSSGAIADFAPRVEEYVDCVLTELDETLKLCKDKELKAVYIGGGTPTTLSAALLEKLLKYVFENCLDRGNKKIEFTLEAGRPDTITKEKLDIAKRYGVTRISINPQTMHQRTLDLIGRKHTVAKIGEAFDLARSCGFDNINMDLIMGLPGEGIEDAKYTLEKIKEFDPECLTIHSLSIKRTAQMDKQSTEGQIVEQMLKLGQEAALKLNMSPYYLYRQKGIAGNFENIGYAKPDTECLYNILIMEELCSIFAVGAGASTKLVLDKPVQNPERGNRAMTKILRCENVSNIEEYISRVPEMIERKQQLVLVFANGYSV